MQQPVDCRHCGTQVLVEKFSWQHTNLQWQRPSSTVCPEVEAVVARGLPPSRARRCESLEESVRRAVLAGDVEVEAD